MQFDLIYDGLPAYRTSSIEDYNATIKQLQGSGCSFRTKIIKAKRNKPSAYVIQLVNAHQPRLGDPTNCPHCGDDLVSFYWCKFCGDITTLDEWKDAVRN